MKKAFSLVEIITVLFIVSIGLLGVLSLIIQNIQSQTYNKNNLAAYQLAQEGIELIRGVRDSNWRAGRPFDADLVNGTFYMDFEDTKPVFVDIDDSNNIFYILRQGEDGFYRHGGSYPASGFYRQIKLSKLNANTLQVDVTVSWQERGRDSSYDLQTLLYNWR